jgi:uncharacterized protein YaaR (DUF327 family)
LKVGGTVGNTSNIKGKIIQEEIKASDALGRGFQASLRHAHAVSNEERIMGLMERIFEQGKKVGDKVEIKELMYYKKLISEFLNEVIDGSYKFSKQNFLDRRGRHRVYAIIKKINKELELLTQDVLSKENDNLGILKRLDDIRGLILDIIM